MAKLQAIIVLGAPGAGKGTQAALLAEKFNLVQIDTGKLCRKAMADFEPESFLEIEGKKYYLKDEKRKYEAGELNSSAFAFYLVKKTIIKATDAGMGTIFSGSPRKIEEAKKLMCFLTDLYGKENIKTFFLKLEVEDSIWRNSNRRICELRGHSILYNKETESLTTCPFDGSKLIKRILDTPEIIKKRFAFFEKDIIPVIEYIKDQDFHFQEIDGKLPVADGLNQILKHI